MKLKELIEKVNNTKGIGIHGTSVQARFMYDYTKYEFGNCQITNTDMVENLLVMTQTAQDFIGKTFKDDHTEALKEARRIHSKYRKSLANPKKHKKNIKLVEATKGLRIYKESIVICDITINRVDNIYLGQCLIGETEKIENFIVMVKSLKDFIYQPITIGKIYNQFKVIPHASSYMVSRKGVIIKKDTLYPMTTHINKAGYEVCNLKYDDGKIATTGVHTAIAMAYLGYIRPSTLSNWTGEMLGDTIVVDHINNIPTDNRLQNLQLLTSVENLAKDKV